LHKRADELRAEGRTPYVIHLGIDHPPLGALGYVVGAEELHRKISDFDVAVVPSGSGAVIIPFLTGCGRRTYAAILSFWAGVMPPMPIFGRSLL